MKIKLLALASLFLVASTSFLSAHGGVELGPNKGRILEFSKDETMHGEVTVKDGKFHIAVLDKEMKPVVVNQQSLVALTGDRDKPTKLQVSQDATGFTVPLVKDGAWLIVQYKETPDSKSVTARMRYETELCECDKPEWLCECKK